MSTEKKIGEGRENEYTRFFYEADRLKSFENWLFSDSANCSRKNAAQAGFIRTGTADELDKARCSLCFILLGEWRATDCPWEEHLKHSPQCHFAQLKRPEALLPRKEKTNLGLF